MDHNVRNTAKSLQVPGRAVLRWIYSEVAPSRTPFGKPLVRISGSTLSHTKTASAPQRGRAHVVKFPQMSEHQHRLETAIERGTVLTLDADAPRCRIVQRIVSTMPLPLGFNRTGLVDTLVNRINLGLRLCYGNIAIPQAGEPIIVPSTAPVLTIAYPSTSLPLGNGDRPEAAALLFLVTPNARTHLLLSMHLACALHDWHLRALLTQHRGRQAVIGAVRRLEVR